MNLPKGYGYVEFKTRVDAEKALAHMDGVCVLFPTKIHMVSLSCCCYQGRFDLFYFVLKPLLYDERKLILVLVLQNAY